VPSKFFDSIFFVQVREKRAKALTPKEPRNELTLEQPSGSGSRDKAQPFWRAQASSS